MAKTVSIPPPGFEELTPDEKVQYIQDLQDYVVADVSKVPVPDWHCRILNERLAEYHAAPHEGTPWPQVRDQLLRELAERIFASIAALESYANELFIDHEKVFPELKPRIMAKLWELYEAETAT